jgi:hypothetical protein
MAVTTIGRRERLDLHVVLRNQLVGIWVQIHLLVHPIERLVAVVVNPSCKRDSNGKDSGPLN